jgi:hypothetical protein
MNGRFPILAGDRVRLKNGSAPVLGTVKAVWPFEATQRDAHYGAVVGVHWDGTPEPEDIGLMATYVLDDLAFRSCGHTDCESNRKLQLACWRSRY